MPEPMIVAQQILGKINELEVYIGKIGILSKEKVDAESNYEKTLAKTIIALKNGREFTLDDETTVNPPTTILINIAKGICWKEKLSMDTLNERLKANDKKIDIIKAQLNGYQSINKHLSEV